MQWTVYLSGEIHTDWRERLEAGARDRQLPIRFTAPVTDHAASDAAGDHLGEPLAGEPLADEPLQGFWRDQRSSRVNAIRTRTLIEHCDVAVIRFGDRYRQWNAAFDAGFCAATNTPYVTLHDEDLVHALKEVDAAAMAWARTPEQVVEVLAYTITG